MIDQRNLRRYAENLVLHSEVFSEQERIGLRILTLLEHAHNPKMVLEKLQAERNQAIITNDLVGDLNSAIKKIKEG